MDRGWGGVGVVRGVKWSLNEWGVEYGVERRWIGGWTRGWIGTEVRSEWVGMG